MENGLNPLSPQHRTILGVAIRNIGRSAVVGILDRALDSKQQVNVCFANAHALNLACDDNRFHSALTRFLVLNDGVGTDVASRLKFGEPFAENLNGTDFVPHFLATTRHNLRLYLVGSIDAVAAEAAEKLRLAYPRHQVVGWRSGFFSRPRDIQETCRTIREAGADCVLVGMGNPLQELWIDEHGEKTGASLLIGVGALFDFQAGAVRRAPLWVRSLRCEWVYRLLQEPQRLARRYLVGNFVFLGRILADARR